MPIGFTFDLLKDLAEGCANKAIEGNLSRTSSVARCKAIELMGLAGLRFMRLVLVDAGPGRGQNERSRIPKRRVRERWIAVQAARRSSRASSRTRRKSALGAKHQVRYCDMKWSQ